MDGTKPTPVAFHDRDRELDALRQRLASPASFGLIFGQRRVGKTFLLQHLLAEREDAVYFLADESTSVSQLARLHGQVIDAGLGGPGWPKQPAGDWGTALTLLIQAAAAEGRSLVLAIDELQYAIAAEPALPSILQRLWDVWHDRLPLHLLLCGSALGTLAALGDVGQPLHGRFDLRLRLPAFGFHEAALFLPDWTPADQLRAYGVFGGLARHLAMIDPALPLADNAIAHLLDPLGALHEAPLDLLRTEHLSHRAQAAAVLAAIAAGENRFGAIAARCGMNKDRLHYVLRELQELDVVRREARVGDSVRSRYVRHRCTDPLTVFWFRLVQPHRGALLRTPPQRLWAERIGPRIDDHMGPIFEQIVGQAVAGGLLDDHIGPIDELGPWWSRDGGTELDLVARSRKEQLYIECKWRPDGMVTTRDLHRLRGHVARYRQITGAPDGPLCLVTSGTFAEPLRSLAETEAVLLFGPETLLPPRGLLSPVRDGFVPIAFTNAAGSSGS